MHFTVLYSCMSRLQLGKQKSNKMNTTIPVKPAAGFVFEEHMFYWDSSTFGFSQVRECLLQNLEFVLLCSVKSTFCEFPFPEYTVYFL